MHDYTNGCKTSYNHNQYCKMGFLIVTDFISFFSYWSGGFDSLESSTHVNIICLNQAWVQLLEMTIRGYWLNWMMMVMIDGTDQWKRTLQQPMSELTVGGLLTGTGGVSSIF